MSTAEKKKLEQVFALWKRKSKDGKKVYFSGKGEREGSSFNLVGFYNTNKKNLNEPDLRVYLQDKEGLSEEAFAALWCNPTKDGKKKILSGKIYGERVVGFINEKASEKQPYISVYWSNDEKAVKEEIKQEAEEDTLPF